MKITILLTIVLLIVNASFAQKRESALKPAAEAHIIEAPDNMHMADIQLLRSVAPEYKSTSLYEGFEEPRVGVFSTGDDTNAVDYSIEKETVMVSFVVNMTGAVAEGDVVFDPDIHSVYITGTFAGWAQPGSDPGFEMNPDTSKDGLLYTITLETEPGDHAYKYFLVESNPSWGIGEWPGDPNREITVVSEMTVRDIWGYHPDFETYYTVVFNVSDQNANPIENAMISIMVRNNKTSSKGLNNNNIYSLSNESLHIHHDAQYDQNHRIITSPTTLCDHLYQGELVFTGATPGETNKGNMQAEKSETTVLYTDAEGNASFEANPDYYTYLVEKNAYTSFSGEFMVTHSDVLLEVVLEEVFAGGSGSEEDPWLIGTAGHLDNVRYYLGEQHGDKFFKQIADIDLNIEPYNSGEGWMPIGHWQDANHFWGNYCGDGHVIDGLFINRPDDTQQGLFGNIREASISGVKLTNVDITAEGRSGGLISESANSQITNCMTSGIVSGNNWILGGLVGFSSGSTVIDNCFSTADVSGLTYIGGLAGVHQVNSLIYNSFSMGNVSGNRYVGGLVGTIASFGNVSNSFSAGSVTGNSDVGGLIGFEMSVSNVINSFWNMASSGQVVSAGGEGKTTAEMTALFTFTDAGWDFKGLGINEIWNIHESVNNAHPFLNWHFPGMEAPAEQIIPTVITEAVTAVDMNSASILAKIINMGNPAATQHGVCWNTSGEPDLGDSSSAEGSVSNAGQFTSFINGLTVNTTYYVRAYAINDEGVHYGNELSFMITSQPAGEGTPDNPYLVATLADLFWLTNDQSAWDKHFLQVENINATETQTWDGGKGWTPIGSSDHPFSGHYNGNGKTIRGLFVNRPYTDYVGLFGSVTDAQINELGLIMAAIKGQSHVGGLAGRAGNNTVIESCFSTGNVTGRGPSIGGLAGRLYGNSTVINSYNMSKVEGLTTGSVARAGLIGNINQATVINCYSAGSVGAYNVAGLIGGFTEGVVENSYWDTEASGVNYSSGGYGRTTAEMTFPYSVNTYVNWNFDDVWATDDNFSINSGYPYLTCFGLVAPPLYSLTLLENPDDIGSTLTGAGDYQETESVTVSASEVEGYTFMNWKDTSGNIVSENPTYSFYMPAENLTLIANFEIDVLVKEPVATGISVFPNPAESALNIASDIQINSIIIIDVVGKTVYRGLLNNTHASISVNSFENGIYFVRCFTDEGVFVKKIQVQK